MSDLVRLSRGVHRPASQLAELGDRCAAFLDVLPPGTVVGGITAARLHGLWLPAAVPDEPLELVITRPGVRPHELAGSRRRELTVRRRALRPAEVGAVDGLPVTGAARTWVDLAATLPLPDLVAAGDSLLRGGAGTDELATAVRDAFRCRGVRAARQALALLDARSRSRPESHVRCALVLAGLPRPEVNVAIHTEHGEWLAEPDLHYRRARVALEYNGAAHADLDRMRRDITRTLDLSEHGWEVVVLGPAEVFGRPWRMVAHVRMLLDRRDAGWWRRRPA